MNVVVEVSDFTFGYDAQPVLADISFQVLEGESVGILGANGSGKSTLLGCLAGLLSGQGRLRLFGDAPAKGRRGRVGVVFQNPEDQLFMPALLDDLTLPLMNAGMAPEAARRRAEECLGEFGLEEYRDRPAHQMSLGQRKRAAIALALVRRPELLLLDEPTAELDGRAVRRLTETLRGIHTTKIIASHHLSFLGEVTTRLLVLGGGGISAHGATPEILADEETLIHAGLY
jgi:cobalt/nickel transport system ATP-binding protein